MSCGQATNRIRELRLRAGLRQDELAEKLGTRPQQIYKLENGQRRLTVDWALRLSEALGCHLLEFLSVESRCPHCGKDYAANPVQETTRTNNAGTGQELDYLRFG